MVLCLDFANFQFCGKTISRCGETTKQLVIIIIIIYLHKIQQQQRKHNAQPQRRHDWGKQLSANSITSICCGFVVYKNLQQSRRHA